MDLVRQARFDSAYTFIYNTRPGTPAADMGAQVAEEVKKRRIQALIKLQNQIGMEKNMEEVGREQEILVEGIGRKESGLMLGRSRGNKIVMFPYSKDLSGEIVSVKITEARLAHLTGELIRFEA
jgi:tRNA-2-methylthio-N6-dimethylallyladenosine synthase